ncbi:zinc finger and BTB domain-containing protein 5-like isoform X40 [Pomacea canaliculata]|uniref:zinc finger and BTB domain-containing protein 5-like isoform X40 n=1 Tax=Pomacea canaliculata TaxID=400727 RepID=UPI000D736495|nr:zinc finger and BTB domain-containing protein 5-like isoform X40 [Pomacea canaliculata]
MDEESASKFINALIKSVQTLCHGYVDFNNGVEIIGYINLSVDKGSSFDYVLKEKVCKNEENSTLFISNSFHAQPKPDKPVKAKNGQVETHISQRRHSVDTSESNQLSSAISSISTVLSGSHSQEKSRSIFSAKDSPASSSSSSSHHIQSTAKRKGEDDVNHDHPPKAANLSHESSSQHFFHPESSPHVSATSSPVDSKPSMSDVAGNVGESSRRTSTVTSEEMQPHIAGTMLPQTATVTSDANSDLGVNLASSVLERIDDQSNSEMQEKDDSDLDLEVTFIKEEYVEGERSACEFQNSGGGQYGRGPDQRASTSSDSMADTPLYPVALHTSAAAATFAPGSHEMAAMAQHYSGIPSSSLGIGAGPSTSHQPGPSGMRDPDQLTHGSAGVLAKRLTRRQAHVDYSGMWSRTSSGLLECKQCSRTFKTWAGLQVHIRQHHLKVFNYVCEKCSKGFMARAHYVGHVNMHNQIKPFKCPRCPMSYFYKQDLRKHFLSKKCT